MTQVTRPQGTRYLSIVTNVLCGSISVVASEDLSVGSANIPDSVSSLGRTSRTRQVMMQAELEHQGYELYRKGKYDEALKKFAEALGPAYISKPEDKNGPLVGIVNTKQQLGEYEEAYKIQQDAISANPPIKAGFVDWWGLHSQELLALIEFKKTGNPQKAHEYLASRRDVIQKLFDVNKMTLDERSYVEKSLYFYEIISDYDAALKLCDE